MPLPALSAAAGAAECGNERAGVAGRSLDEVERALIRSNLELMDGNRKKAAEVMGIGERTLYRKIKEYGLS